MSGRGEGRDRPRRDHLGSASSGRSNAPPSRHLWVGNLSHRVAEQDLTDQFLRFGELESVAFQPGRSYAFINFKNEDDANVAMKSLQGFPLIGNPLRVEFAKADKSGTALQDEDQYSTLRGSPFSQRDPRAHHASPETFNPNKSKTNDRSAEPSEVLWIGFPTLLKVDEAILRKAFSPFGEIEKITVFPGRSYAFVQFRSLMSACRAKETLQGKLFGNPRVHICFSRSENSGRGSMNDPLSSHFKSNGRAGSSESFLHDRNFLSLTDDTSIRSPYKPNLDSGDSEVYSLKRKSTSWSSGNSAYEPWRFGEVEPDSQIQEDMYEHNRSPMRFHDYPQKFVKKSSVYEEPWDDMPEDAYSVHGTKKLRIGSFPPERELLEYPLSDLEQEDHAFPRVLSDFPQSDSFGKNFDVGNFGYKQISNRPVNSAMPHGERNDHWKPSYDGFQVGSGSLPSNLVERKRLTPELDQPSLKEWKWEGTIAKGGTPVCRARCFPVGKVLDIMLPELLDCTARTGLDMLAKHYYQASSAWVVFFVPESDADIGFYNEFMHYLEEKQRAAVAKLDDRTTLFLVPPSDFSEKVLKVPGKLSISGVILRLELPSFGAVLPNLNKDATLFRGDSLYGRPASFPSVTSYPELSKSGSSDLSFQGNAAKSAQPMSFSGSAHDIGHPSDQYNENGHEHPLHSCNPLSIPNWCSHDLQTSASVARNISFQVSSVVLDPIQAHDSAMPRAMQEASSSNYPGGISGIPLPGHSKPSHQEAKTSVPLSSPFSAIQSEQLAQLASSLLGQQRQAGSTPNISTGETFRQTNTAEQSDMLRPSQGYALQNNQVTPELSTSHITQMQQLQQQQTSNVPVTIPPVAQREFQPGAEINQQLQSTSTQEEADSDPQKRLQATLQLAAALLQQIQQAKGT
ncbi:hypothetical protein SLE2022_120180 [Rubroshorea leprosula]